MHQQHPSRVTRRTFIKSIALAGATLPWAMPRLARAASPNGMLRFAGIGVNGMGWSDVSSIGSHPKVSMAALCDIDSARFGEAAKRWPDAPRFQDFRDMFDKMGKDIDAVNVTIPDHMHAYVALHAMRLGKHVYCQKPLTHTLWEARKMAQVAAEQKVITRMGNQIHSQIEYRMAVRMIKDGLIGKVSQVHSWVGASGKGFVALEAPPQKSDPVPDTINWDHWIGVAPMRPYVNGIYHPFNWRAWKDFGGGGLGDFGCHIFDPPFSALDLTAPKTIVAEQEGMTEQRWPGTSKVSYVFPGTPFTTDPVELYWYDGGRQPDRALAPQMPAGQNFPGAGSLFIGDKGIMVLPHVGGPRVFPQDLLSSWAKPDLGSRHHWHGWVDACLSNDTTLTDQFAYAGPLTETVNLGLIAVTLPGEKLEWDAPNMKITNNEKAQTLTTREYRKGWEIS